MVRSDAEREACAPLMCASEPCRTLGRSHQDSLPIVSDPGREVDWVEHGPEWAGFLVLCMHGRFRGYLQTIRLRPECRGRGLGTAVPRWAEARIHRDSPNVFMCVSDSDLDAFRLYRRLGYEAVGRLESLLVEGRAEILLRRSTARWSTFRPVPGR